MWPFENLKKNGFLNIQTPSCASRCTTGDSQKQLLKKKKNSPHLVHWVMVAFIINSDLFVEM